MANAMRDLRCARSGALRFVPRIASLRGLVARMPPLRSPVRARAMLRMQRGHACGARAHAAGFRRNGRGGVVRRRRRAHRAHLERRRRETPGTRDGTAHAAPGAARMACKRGSGAHTRERRRTPPTWVRPRPGACMHSRRSGGDPRDRSWGRLPRSSRARTPFTMATRKTAFGA